MVKVDMAENKNKVTKDLIATMARLSWLKVDPKERDYFTGQFVEILKVVNQFNEVDTKGVAGTDQVTGLNNVYRKDKIDKERMLTQKQALSGAKKTYNGYFVVGGVFDED
jgi:aspartyl/glutamyl-tRNA(Asn/Gln) amidotransferase C subunit